MARRISAFDDDFIAAFMDLAIRLKASDTIVEALSTELQLGQGFQIVADLHLEEVWRWSHAGLTKQLNDARQASINLARFNFRRRYGDQVAGLTLEPDLLRSRNLTELGDELEHEEWHTVHEYGRYFLIGRLSRTGDVVRFFLGVNPDFERGRERYLTELFCYTALADAEEFSFDQTIKPEFENALS